MHYRTLGKTGLEVSILGFGASPLGNVFDPVDEKEGISAVHYALDHGVNFFDVAPFYGLTLGLEKHWKDHGKISFSQASVVVTICSILIFLEIESSKALTNP
jgi:aryl-alcohol dehydrogenase-like predicted oxidoreductase